MIELRYCLRNLVQKNSLINCASTLKREIHGSKENQQLKYGEINASVKIYAIIKLKNITSKLQIERYSEVKFASTVSPHHITTNQPTSDFD